MFKMEVKYKQIDSGLQCFFTKYYSVTAGEIVNFMTVN